MKYRRPLRYKAKIIGHEDRGRNMIETAYGFMTIAHVSVVTIRTRKAKPPVKVSLCVDERAMDERLQPAQARWNIERGMLEAKFPRIETAGAYNE